MVLKSLVVFSHAHIIVYVYIIIIAYHALILNPSLAYTRASSPQLSSLSSSVYLLSSMWTPYLPLKKETAVKHLVPACLDFLWGDSVIFLVSEGLPFYNICFQLPNLRCVERKLTKDALTAFLWQEYVYRDRSYFNSTKHKDIGNISKFKFPKLPCPCLN